MTGTAAAFMVETLQRVGVKRIYGVVGDSLNGFTDALRRAKTIEWVHMRHEERAAFAAAEAHIAGELAVCVGSGGPGAQGSVGPRPPVDRPRLGRSRAMRCAPMSRRFTRCRIQI